MKRIILLVCLIITCPLLMSQDKNNLIIRSGEVWPDNDGNHINAHGGGIFNYKGTWYWFGESRPAPNEKDRTKYGVGYYSSKDHVNWKNEGVALRVINDTASLQGRRIILSLWPTGGLRQTWPTVVKYGSRLNGRMDCQ